MLVCDIYNKSNWAKVRVWVRKRWDDVHVYDVALSGNTVRNMAVGLWLVGNPWWNMPCYCAVHRAGATQRCVVRKAEKAFTNFTPNLQLLALFQVIRLKPCSVARGSVQVWVRSSVRELGFLDYSHTKCHREMALSNYLMATTFCNDANRYLYIIHTSASKLN